MTGEQKPFSPSEEEWFKKGEEMQTKTSEFTPDQKNVETEAKAQTEKEFFGGQDIDTKKEAA